MLLLYIFGCASSCVYINKQELCPFLIVYPFLSRQPVPLDHCKDFRPSLSMATATAVQISPMVLQIFPMFSPWFCRWCKGFLGSSF